MTLNETLEGERWLLLVHQLPAKPAYARVKIWRRLKGLGAVTVKNSVYALPANAETQEDFAWLTERLCGFAGGRVVSTLEGGYDLGALTESVAAHVGVLAS